MKLNANGTEISIIHDQLFENDYLSLTDLARRKNPYEPKDVVKNWLRLRSTIEFLGLWEKLYNTQFKGVEFDTFKNESGSNSFTLTPVVKNWLRLRSTIEFLGLWEKLYNTQFKGVEFDTFKNESGSNSFTLTPQRWIEKTNAIGMISKSGRGGGTYAHTDIAFEFASWISPEFKLYVIKDYQRLKQIEAEHLETGWNTKRELSRINYHIHTDAIKEFLITPELTKKEQSYTYASEADILNIAYYQLKSLEKSNITEKLRKNIPQKEK